MRQLNYSMSEEEKIESELWELIYYRFQENMLVVKSFGWCGTRIVDEITEEYVNCDCRKT